MVFDESDIYYRDCTPATWNGYVVEGFVLPVTQLSAVWQQDDRHMVRVLHPFYQGTGALFDLRVIILPNQPAFLGILVHRLIYAHKSPSGFTFGGPSDGTYMLNAIYPLPEGEKAEGSLDYRAPQ